MKDSNNQPPKAASKLLAWFAGSADLEDIQGDIDEMYIHKQKSKGRLVAKIFYWRHIISLLFSYALLKRKRQQALPDYYAMNNLSMIKNYVKVSLRNMRKQRMFTAINIFGLAMGMSVSLLILSVIIQSLRFDDFQENKLRMARVITTVENEDGINRFATTTPALYNELSQSVTGIEAVVRLKYSLNHTLFHDDNEIEISGVYTDSAYFQLFSFDLKYGSKATALDEPNSIILSPKLAKKLFDDRNPVGETLTTVDKQSLLITGVLMEHPRQTHLNFEAIGSYSTIENSGSYKGTIVDQWNDYYYSYIYLLMEERKTVADFTEVISAFNVKASQIFDNKKITFGLQEFDQISPGKNLNRDNTPFDWTTSIAFFFMGFLILVPAVFNYTNLMIARSLKRAKEIGIRKVVGSSRTQIGAQFIVEAILLSLLALIGTVIIFTIIRAEFINMIAGGESLDLSLNLRLILAAILFGLFVGIFAGIFPALYFSKLTPLKSLGNAISASGSISFTRKSLIVVQFSISLVFLIGIAVITRQHLEILNYDIGFNKENILVVPLKNVDHELLKQEFVQIAGIEGITMASIMPGVEAGIGSTYLRSLSNFEDSINTKEIYVDESFVPLLGFNVLWGDNLGDSRSTDLEKVLVNRELMRQNRIVNPTADSTFHFLNGTQKVQIVGVVEDFNFMQLNMGMSPLVIRSINDNARFMLLKTNRNADLLAQLEQLEQGWSNVEQEASFDSYFLDHRIEESYTSTQGILKIFGFLGILSICISCIGLLGMVVYFTENRVKEVAIRKIMGASLFNLYQILGGSFLKLLLIAVCISTPLAYFFYEMLFVHMINKFSTGVGFIEIILSIVFMLTLGLLPVLWIVAKVARLNPANNLRTE
ncbi:MAG: FtsX-like permease family protein [Cyclobacteriaceae bacterium]